MIVNDHVILGQDLHFLESFHQPVEGQSSFLSSTDDTTRFPQAIQKILGHSSTVAICEVLNSSAELDEVSLAIEDVMSAPAIDDILDAQRWFSIDNADCGFSHENLLFRTFVNAQIGSKDERVKTQDAPYMLILWTKQGESEIFISLCNQRNTLNLSRIFSSRDLENYEQKGEDCLEISVEFPSQEAEIRFLNIEDSRAFCAQPRRYFQAMAGRDPIRGELAIFNTVLESFEDRDGPQIPTSSCGLRIYESMPHQRCKTTRRLVVSSPAGDASITPWCASHWIPLSKIRLQIDDSLVTMSWSDLKQCEKIGRGNFDYHFAYVYKPEEPNRKLFMRFSSGYEAERFEECIFFLTEAQDHVERRSTMEIPATGQELRVYDLQDEIDRSRYHVIALAIRSSLMHMCELYYSRCSSR